MSRVIATSEPPHSAHFAMPLRRYSARCGRHVREFIPRSRGAEGEDATHHGRLLLVDAADDVRSSAVGAGDVDVVVAVDFAASNVAGPGFPDHRIVSIAHLGGSASWWRWPALIVTACNYVRNTLSDRRIRA